MEKYYNANQQIHKLPSNLNNVLIYVNSYRFRASLAHFLDGQVCAFFSLHCNNRIIMQGMENVQYDGKCHKYELYLLQYSIVRVC